MNLPFTFDLLLFAMACYVAQLSRRFSRAPGWEDQRWFSYAALTVAAYTALNFTTTAPELFSDRALVVASRLQSGVVAVHAVCWLRYSASHLRIAPPRWQEWLERVLVAIAPIAALTPIAYGGGGVERWAYPALGAVYRDAQATVFGNAYLALGLGALVVPIARFAAAWRRGAPEAAVQTLGLLGFLVLAANDLLVQARVYVAPYLVDLGLILPVVGVANALSARFVADARVLDDLRQHLSREVEERTRQLSLAQDALHRAEKLAALGQFAAGVAHEVNNPTAVVNANVHYLLEAEGDALSEDGREALRESLASTRRIGAIVRQLLDAGRLAAVVDRVHPVEVRHVVEDAGSAARARYGKRANVVNRVGSGVFAVAEEGVLLQVLSNLVVNAVQAMPETQRDGRVEVRAERDGARVRIVVDDNGAGMDEETLRRAFEPFFTTKPVGMGTGLGLAVSRGLVLGLGGDLRLESARGAGTRAILELAAAEPPDAAAQDEQDAGSGRRLRLLLVDDEPSIRASLRRVLGGRYDVEVAATVEDALLRAGAGPLDAVLCDVMMPDGGGERLLRELERRASPLARRVVFVTGGAANEAARRFLSGQRQPVVLKPVDLEELAAALERVEREAPRARELRVVR